jgi:hypothetical protein
MLVITLHAAVVPNTYVCAIVSYLAQQQSVAHMSTHTLELSVMTAAHHEGYWRTAGMLCKDA